MRNPTHTQCSTTEGLAPENRLTERLVGWKIHDARLILYWLNTQKSWNRSRRGVWTGDWCHASQCWERYALVDEKVSNVGGVRSQMPTVCTHSKAVMASTAKTHKSLLMSTGWIRLSVFPSTNVLGSIWTSPAAQQQGSDLHHSWCWDPKTLRGCYEGGHLLTASIQETLVWVDNAMKNCWVHGNQWTEGLPSNH